MGATEKPWPYRWETASSNPEDATSESEGRHTLLSITGTLANQLVYAEEARKHFPLFMSRFFKKHVLAFILLDL